MSQNCMIGGLMSQNCMIGVTLLLHNVYIHIDSLLPPDERDDLYFTEMYDLTEVRNYMQLHVSAVYQIFN